jgi:anti-sigma-K factor RskA
MTRHDEIRELLTDYVLGDLPSSESAAVHRHLDECAACAAEARDLASAFEAIGQSIEPIAPPAHVRGRVLDRLAREAQGRSHALAAAVRPARRAPRGRPVWLAAAALALLVLAGLLALAQQRVGRLDDALRAAESDVARLTGDAAAVAEQADLAVTILTATDMRRIDLQGFEASRAATARAYWSATKGLLIVADRLPPPPPGRTYQVWLIGGGATGPVSAGLIDTRNSGRGMLIVPPPAGASDGSVTVAVTDEPLGGLAAPTGSKHLAGSL